MAAKSERSRQKFDDDMDRFILSVTREKPGIVFVMDYGGIVTIGSMTAIMLSNMLCKHFYRWKKNDLKDRSLMFGLICYFDVILLFF